jgi:hypothetical protein
LPRLYLNKIIVGEASPSYPLTKKKLNALPRIVL